MRLQNEMIQRILERYEFNEDFAIRVDRYIDSYMNVDTKRSVVYTLDDVEGILYSMSNESLIYILSLQSSVWNIGDFCHDNTYVPEWLKKSKIKIEVGVAEFPPYTVQTLMIGMHLFTVALTGIEINRINQTKLGATFVITHYDLHQNTPGIDYSIKYYDCKNHKEIEDVCADCIEMPCVFDTNPVPEGDAICNAGDQLDYREGYLKLFLQEENDSVEFQADIDNEKILVNVNIGGVHLVLSDMTV